MFLEKKSAKFTVSYTQMSLEPKSVKFTAS